MPVRAIGARGAVVGRHGRSRRSAPDHDSAPDHLDARVSSSTSAGRRSRPSVGTESSITVTAPDGIALHRHRAEARSAVEPARAVQHADLVDGESGGLHRATDHRAGRLGRAAAHVRVRRCLRPLACRAVGVRTRRRGPTHPHAAPPTASVADGFLVFDPASSVDPRSRSTRPMSSRSATQIGIYRSQHVPGGLSDRGEQRPGARHTATSPR